VHPRRAGAWRLALAPRGVWAAELRPGSAAAPAAATAGGRDGELPARARRRHGRQRPPAAGQAIWLPGLGGRINDCDCRRQGGRAACPGSAAASTTASAEGSGSRVGCSTSAYALPTATAGGRAGDLAARARRPHQRLRLPAARKPSRLPDLGVRPGDCDRRRQGGRAGCPGSAAASTTVTASGRAGDLAARARRPHGRQRPPAAGRASWLPRLGGRIDDCDCQRQGRRSGCPGSAAASTIASAEGSGGRVGCSILAYALATATGDRQEAESAARPRHTPWRLRPPASRTASRLPDLGVRRGDCNRRRAGSRVGCQTSAHAVATATADGRAVELAARARRPHERQRAPKAQEDESAARPWRPHRRLRAPKAQEDESAARPRRTPWRVRPSAARKPSRLLDLGVRPGDCDRRARPASPPPLPPMVAGAGADAEPGQPDRPHPSQPAAGAPGCTAGTGLGPSARPAPGSGRGRASGRASA